MNGLWSEREQALVESKMGVAIIGSPETVERKLTDLVNRSGVDEVIFTSDLYRHEDRLRSYEIAASAANKYRQALISPQSSGESGEVLMNQRP
jgi:alkanesulfonate monooxygenase SsuD/methylene tetrahydromethanopterin reductase-like flavin-dependent oxidoreductase (luciferase family)